MSDSMVGTRKIRTFNVMDDCSREALAIEEDTSLSAPRVIRTLEKIIDHRGKLTSQESIRRMATLNCSTGFTEKQY